MTREQGRAIGRGGGSRELSTFDRVTRVSGNIISAYYTR